MSNLVFNGHDIGAAFAAYGDPEITLLKSRVDYADGESFDGVKVLGKTWGETKVSFSLGINGTAEQRRTQLSTLGMWLDVDEPKHLVLPDTPDWYYLAIPDGEVSTTRGISGEIAIVSFTLTDPIAYGELKSVEVPYGGSVTFTVGGTAPTRPRFYTSLNVRPDTSTYLYGLILDNADVLQIQRSSSSTFGFDIDCEARTCLVNNAVALPTLNSDWFELTPGEHTIANNHGGGSYALCRYYERWL